MATRVRFSKIEFRKELMKHKKLIEAEQTARLIAYAKEEIVKMGELIAQNVISGQDETTGNLLDSLCWGVWFKRKRMGSGYFREPQASEESYLHELSPQNRQSVNGHALAQQFLREYGDGITQNDGWHIVWGVLAPYYVYWEQGHINVLRGGEFVKFDAMSQRYDHIENVLKPQCKVGFWVALNPQ